MMEYLGYTANVASGQRVLQSVGGAGRIVLFAIALMLLGLAASVASGAKAAPQLAIAISQGDSATSAIASDRRRQDTCSICGRLVCPIPDDLLAAASPANTALPSATPVVLPIIGACWSPNARVENAFVLTFPTSFESRGPPFVD
jgi:hypothetical protein